jgi:predicted membrane protein
MIILLTTSNFPDVMLPSYDANPNAFIFYFLFLTFGLFFLMNVLLAVVYSNYQRQIVEQAEKKTKKRLMHITSCYHCYDVEKKSYLTIEEAKRFFGYIMNMNYKSKQDRQSFKNIMMTIDPEIE